jgi:hypothetical protein
MSSLHIFLNIKLLDHFPPHLAGFLGGKGNAPLPQTFEFEFEFYLSEKNRKIS